MTDIDIHERLTKLEVQNEQQLAILTKMAGLPEMCASRGVQIQSLLDADLPTRVTKLEGTNQYLKWVASVTAGVVAWLSGSSLWEYLIRAIR